MSVSALWRTPTFCNCVSNLLHSSFFCSMAISSDLSFESFLRPEDARDEACSLRSMRLDCRWTDGTGSKQTNQTQWQEVYLGAQCHIWQLKGHIKTYWKEQIQYNLYSTNKEVLGMLSTTQQRNQGTSYVRYAIMCTPLHTQKNLFVPYTLTDLFVC